MNMRLKYLGYKKGKDNQKQQLSEYSYIATHIQLKTLISAKAKN